MLSSGIWRSGKRRFLENIFIERQWRSLKYECAYLHAWETGSDAQAGAGRWIWFLQSNNKHSAQSGRPPALVYWHRNDINLTGQRVRPAA